MTSRLLVTGTGRCGTGYVAALLTRLGLPCTHEEAYGPRGPMGWQTAAEASWMAVPWLRKIETVLILHLVRHPLDVLWSFLRLGLFEDGDRGAPHGIYRAFLETHAQETFDLREPIARAADFILFWNRWIEPCSVLRWRLEDIGSEHFVELFDWLERPAPSGDAILAALEHTPTSINARLGYGGIDRPTWADVPESIRDPLRKQAAAYGYQEETP